MIKLKGITVIVLAGMMVAGMSLSGYQAQDISADQKEKILIQETKVNLLEEEKLLNQKNIKVIIDKNGNMKLEKVNAETIRLANQTLNKSSKKYPTKWYPLINYSVYTSKKFKKATKNAFAAGMSNWLMTKIPNPQTIVGAAVAAYATYYFVNSDECNVYFRYLYYYRIIGPTKFDNNGNAIGQYELKRRMTTSKSKKFTSGQDKIQTKKSSILEW